MHPTIANASSETGVNQHVNAGSDTRRNRLRLKRFLEAEDLAEDRPVKRVRVHQNSAIVSCQLLCWESIANC